MSEPQPWQSIVDVAILHPTHAQLLVQQKDQGWALPRVPLRQVWLEPLQQVSAEMQNALGLATTVLQKLAEGRDEANRLAYFLFLLEPQTPLWTPPPGVRWLGAADLDAVGFTHPAHCLAVATRLHEIEQGVIPPLRAPNARSGWRQAAERWIESQVMALGYPLTGPIIQIKNWFLSCILCAPTTQGKVYFKASNRSPLMVNEAQITQALARLFPAALPAPLAIAPAQDWMLLADFGQELGWQAPVETREAVLQAFARLQIATATRIDELLAMGCIDRRLPILAAQVDPLLTDSAMLAYVDAEQQAQLRAAAPILKALCARLDQYNVPATLVHGDMHMSNVAARDADYLFFDWSDACITHPFLDMISILHEADPELQNRLRDGYLALWTAYEPLDRLLEMWELAYLLCALHQAVSYQAIIANCEDACKYEMDWAMPFWFGKILEALKVTR